MLNHRNRLQRLIQILTLSVVAGCAGTLAQAQQQPIRINAGGARSTFVASDGSQWLTDRSFAGGDLMYASGYVIGNTKDSYLYATGRYGLYSDFEYDIPVLNGPYTLTLKFAELSYWQKGQRVFNVLANGATLLSKFDILAEVPSRTALDKSFPVNVTNGMLRVRFVGVVRKGIVSAIEVAPAVATAPVPAPAQPVTISVYPASTSLSSGGTAQFTATVANTTNTAVAWTASAGSITSTGFYTAPAVTSAASVAITAVSAADPTQKASAAVTVNPPAAPVKVSVNPASTSVTCGGTAQFAATVANTTNTAVTWTASAGSITSAGLYTPPSVTSATTVTVTATSVATASAKASAAVTVNPIIKPILGISPASLTFSATAGGSNPASQNVSIANTGNGTLSWTASASAAWLTLSAKSGTAPSTLSIGIATSGLSAGTYTGTVTLAAGTAGSQAVAVNLTVLSASAPAPVTSTGWGSPGKVSIMKNCTPAFDPYTGSPTTSMQQFLNQHIGRMVVFSPYFDSRTSWYPNGLIYIDSYAIYPSGNNGVDLVGTHPEWIMTDAGGNRLYIPWGCSGGTCPQYAADFSNPGYQQWWVNNARRCWPRAITKASGSTT